MRTALRWVALGIVMVGTAFWFFGGPNLGWTRTTVAIPKQDPVTEQSYIQWEPRFVPGVDFVAGCLAAGGVVFALSWLAKARPRTP